MSRVNGRAIEDYKRFEIKETGLAVPKAESLYLPAISNGYAPYDFIVDDYLLLYLPLYLFKGSSFKSVDRYKRSCTVTGALWRPNGRHFDGSDDLVSCGDITQINEATLLSVDCWFKADNVDPDDDAFWGKRVSGDVEVAAYFSVGDCYNKIAITGQYATFNQSLDTSLWYHHALVYNGSGATNSDKLKAYLNGVAKTLTFTGAPPTAIGDLTDAPFTVGAKLAGKSHWDGRVGEIRVYSRALSAAEVLHNYNATKWRYQ